MIEPYDKTFFDDLVKSSGSYNRFYLKDKIEDEQCNTNSITMESSE